MNKIFFLFLFLLPLSLIAQRTIAFEGLSEKEEIYYYKDKPFTGKSIRKHVNNKKAQEAQWKDGKLHGTKREWWKSGAIRESMNFVAGYRHGEFSRYYDNGALKIKGTYEKNLLEGPFYGFFRNGNKEYLYHYKQSVKDGMSTTYFDYSKKQSFADVGYKEQEVLYVNGVPHGELNSYYRAGNPRRTINYEMGVLNGPSMMYHINANPADESYYKMGKRDSIRRVYDNLIGTLISQEYYIDGKKDGPWISFDQIGDTITLTHYKNNQLHGTYTSYIDNEVNNYGEYVNGKKDGAWKTGLVNNYRRTNGSYDMGTEVGEWIYYDIEGKKLMRRVFDSEGYITEEDIY